MAIKYNIYYSTVLQGPWTLATVTPIDHVPSTVHEFEVTGLKTGTAYYIAIVAGDDASGEWIPLVGQSIGPNSISVGGVGVPSMRTFKVVPFGPSIDDTIAVGHRFTVV